MSCRISIPLAFSLAAFSLAHAQTKSAATTENKATTKTAAKSSSPVNAALGADEERDRLPVQRVVLYKNGVGYFEHSARFAVSRS